MYARTTIVAALLAIAPLAHASDSIADLSRQSGLSERNVRMILGARTPYAEYRCCYSRMLIQFKATVGEENYRRLADGRNMLRNGFASSRQDEVRDEALVSVQARAR